jgi:hypothetical protein
MNEDGKHFEVPACWTSPLWNHRSLSSGPIRLSNTSTLPDQGRFLFRLVALGLMAAGGFALIQLVTGMGLVIGGASILLIGSTRVFVPQDVRYLGLGAKRSGGHLQQ